MFMGKAYEDSSFVGNWWAVLRHTKTENIEVCGGTNDLLKVRLVVNLNDGSLDGHRLVLGLKNPEDPNDVVWDSMAPLCGPACHDESCICPNDLNEIEEWVCSSDMPDGYGPVATIPGSPTKPVLELKAKWGTTVTIDDAYLFGYLCHNWEFIPRVAATLTVILLDD